MFEIRGIIFKRVEAERTSRDPPTGLSLKIDVEDIRAKDDEIEIDFAYTAKYEQGIGFLKIEGTVMAKDTAEEAHRIAEKWKMERKLDDDVARPLYNWIYFLVGTNGFLASKLLRLPVPMYPPRTEIKSEAH